MVGISLLPVVTMGPRGYEDHQDVAQDLRRARRIDPLQAGDTATVIDNVAIQNTLVASKIEDLPATLVLPSELHVGTKLVGI
jgi:hypothetical protein